MDTDVPTNAFELDDTVYRHIGKVVATAAHIEGELTDYLVLLVAGMQSAPSVRKLIQGRRLAELIDLSEALMPPYADKPGFIKKLREANDYRDLVAHSVRTFGTDETGTLVDHDRLDRQWRVRQRRKQSESFPLDLADMRRREADFVILHAIADCLLVSVVLSGGSGDGPVVASIVEEATRANPDLWRPDHMRIALAQILGIEVPNAQG